MAKITEVVALEKGHDGRMFREAGERFSLDLDDKRYDGATWFAPVDSPKVAEAARAKAEAEKRARAGIPTGAGPKRGSAEPDAPVVPGAGPIPGSSDMV